MKKSYTIAGVGVCLGKNPGFETLVESIITGSPIAGQFLPDPWLWQYRKPHSIQPGKILLI